MKFMRVRKLKQDAVRYLNEGDGIVALKTKETVSPPCSGTGADCGDAPVIDASKVSKPSSFIERHPVSFCVA